MKKNKKQTIELAKFTKLTLSVLALVLVSSISFSAYGQTTVFAEVNNGDTTPVVHLKTITVTGTLPDEQKRAVFTSNAKLLRNIKKVMPLAIACSEKVREFDANLASFEKNKEKKQFLKQQEKDLFAEYEPQLKKLTKSQGMLLIKLIDRQTGRNSYELIKLYKSGTSAFVWNSFAGLFGVSLKEEYDPKEEQQIEVILNYLGY